MNKYFNLKKHQSKIHENDENILCWMTLYIELYN